MHAPYAVLEKYFSGIPSLPGGVQQALDNGRFLSGVCTLIVPCDVKLPAIEMHLGNGTAVFRDILLIELPVGNKTYCAPVLQMHWEIGINDQKQFGCKPRLPTIGAPFFQNYYTVFNQAEPSISFAPYAKSRD